MSLEEDLSRRLPAKGVMSAAAKINSITCLVVTSPIAPSPMALDALQDVQLLEMHGTGTPLGDPIEVGAAAAVFQGQSARPTSYFKFKSHPSCSGNSWRLVLVCFASEIASFQLGALSGQPFRHLARPSSSWSAAVLTLDSGPFLDTCKCGSRMFGRRRHLAGTL